MGILLVLLAFLGKTAVLLASCWLMFVGIMLIVIKLDYKDAVTIPWYEYLRIPVSVIGFVIFAYLI